MEPIQVKSKIAIISKNRPLNVEKMARFVDISRVTWYVGEGEVELYEMAGARRVVEAGGLMQARNKAIDDAQKDGAWSIQLSDDLTKLTDPDGINLTVPDAIGILITRAMAIGARYAGCAPTANKFYFNPQKPISTHHFIVGDFIAIAPDCPIRFDTSLKLKEDYDYTLQHLKNYGVVARCNDILASFRHRDNHGGAVDYRSSQTEQEAIKYLKQKWGELIRDNPRRPNEILMKWSVK